MADAARSWDSDIKEIGDKIVAMTLLQAKELGDYLKEEHGLEAAAGGMMMAAPAAGGDAGAEAEPTEFDVILTSIGNQKIQVIKAVRAITGLGLKEAKEVVDNAPKSIKQAIAKDEAEEIKAKLEEVGAVADVKAS